MATERLQGFFLQVAFGFLVIAFGHVFEMGEAKLTHDVASHCVVVQRFGVRGKKDQRVKVDTFAAR